MDQGLATESLHTFESRAPSHLTAGVLMTFLQQYWGMKVAALQSLREPRRLETPTPSGPGPGPGNTRQAASPCAPPRPRLQVVRGIMKMAAGDKSGREKEN